MADSLYSQVALLLHGNGANASTAVFDSSSSPRTLTAFGNAQISTAQSKFGGSSIALDGTGDYLSTPSFAGADLGSSDFTLEGQFFCTDATVDQVLLASHNSATPNGWVLRYSPTSSPAGLRFVAAAGGASDNFQFAWTPTINTWYHVAVVRSGNTITAYIDGNVVGTGTLVNATTLGASGQPLTIGAQLLSGSPFNFMKGYLDELRITKGTARYTAAFTPPTAAFGDLDDATALLMSWSPTDKGASVTLSNGSFAAYTDINGSVRATRGVSSGKWYWEYVVSDNQAALVGVSKAGAPTSPNPAYPGVDANGYAINCVNGFKYNGSGGTAYHGAAIPLGTVIGVKLDLDAGTLGFVIGGSDKGVAFSGLAGTFYPHVGGGSSAFVAKVTANFGFSSFATAIPSGYTPLASSFRSRAATGLASTVAFGTPTALLESDAVAQATGFTSTTFGATTASWPQTEQATSLGPLTQFGTPSGMLTTDQVAVATGFAATVFGLPVSVNRATGFTSAAFGRPSVPSDVTCKARSTKSGGVGVPALLRYTHTGPLNWRGAAQTIHKTKFGLPRV